MHKAGDVWIERKGESFSFYNKGKVPYVDIFVTRVPKKKTSAARSGVYRSAHSDRARFTRRLSAR